MKCEFERAKDVCSKGNFGCPKNKKFCMLKAPLKFNPGDSD
jgi:hypothetical protein